MPLPIDSGIFIIHFFKRSSFCLFKISLFEVPAKSVAQNKEQCTQYEEKGRHDFNIMTTLFLIRGLS